MCIRDRSIPESIIAITVPLPSKLLYKLFPIYAISVACRTGTPCNKLFVIFIRELIAYDLSHHRCV